MDPVSIVKTLFTLAMSIKTWLDNIKEKDSTIAAISANVNRISVILAPFKDAAVLEPIIKDSLLAVGDALARTKEHLSVWGSKRTKQRSNSLGFVTEFLDPSGVTRQLKEDERQLSQQIMIMLFSLAASTYFRDHSPVMSEEIKDNFIFGSIFNDELLEFWRKYIGTEMYSVTNHTLCQALKRWLGPGVNELTLKSLIFRLDEFITGEVSLANLEIFVGKRSLRNMIQELEGTRTRVRSFWTQTSALLPLIVWIDDAPANNVQEVQFAQNLNIKVIQLRSTALAKDWIEENEEFLQGNDTSSRIRFISDNTRLEIDPMQDLRVGPFLNLSAGENILRYLRGRLYSVPVLIYCGLSINVTEYVLSYDDAGSTVNQDVVKSYIQALANGRDDDYGWKGFMGSRAS